MKEREVEDKGQNAATLLSWRTSVRGVMQERLAPTPLSISIHIEDLILNGFNPTERYLISEVIQRELSRLLCERGSSASLEVDSRTDRIDGGSFPLILGATPKTIGNQVARAVYGGMAW
jgi:hypothetical protein